MHNAHDLGLLVLLRVDEGLLLAHNRGVLNRRERSVIKKQFSALAS